MMSFNLWFALFYKKQKSHLRKIVAYFDKINLIYLLGAILNRKQLNNTCRFTLVF